MCSPGEGRGANNTGQREKARAGPAMPENTATSTVGQDCKGAVSDGSGLQRRFWKLPGLPTLLCGSSRRRQLLPSLQPARAACRDAGRGTPRAGGACRLLPLEATVGSPGPHQPQGPRCGARGQHELPPRLQTAGRCPARRASRALPGEDIAAACPGVSFTPRCQRQGRLFWILREPVFKEKLLQTGRDSRISPASRWWPSPASS